MAAIERYPVVLKFDGLAAGKGVVIAADEAQAREALERFLVQERFGPGAWWSRRRSRARSSRCWRCATARRAVPMAPAQDYKRIFDGDRGPNTGGMGSYSPVPGIDRARVEESCARSTSRWSTSCATAARRSTAASTPG
jgi:phosphoribosylamine--glycine ligase